jgi:serine/threonine-protein kinase RsbT
VSPVENRALDVAIFSDADIVLARQKARQLASELGFSVTELAVIATAVSELARNIVLYARRGEVLLKLVEQGGRRGIVVTARDDGPGIADVARAMQSGYSTSGSLGLGLPGVKRLMDDFELVTEMGKGTVITVRKWKG